MSIIIINIVLVLFCLFLFIFVFSILGNININQRLIPVLIENNYYKTIYAQTEKLYNEEIQPIGIAPFFDRRIFFEDNSLNNKNRNYKDKIEIEASVIYDIANGIHEPRKNSDNYEYDNKQV